MIWIVLPAYNEEVALSSLLQSLTEQMREEQRDFQILVVNDGSQDRTGEVARKHASLGAPIRLLNNPTNRGLAETLRRGLLEALSHAAPNDIIITMDADDTHPAGLAIRMARLIREGNDVVVASRYRQGSFVRGLAWHRRFLSWVASWLFRWCFPIRGIRDYTCSYRAYRVKVLHDLMARRGKQMISEKGFACMVEILLSLREQDLIFAEVPLILRYDQKPGRSKMNVSKTIRDTLLLILRRRFSLEHGPS